MKKKLAAWAALMAMALTSADAYAACVRRDLGGLWAAYVNFEDAAGNFGYFSCAFAVSNTGTIQNGSGCAGNVPATGAFSFANADLCIVRGRFRRGADLYEFQGSMAEDNLTIHGVGNQGSDEFYNIQIVRSIPSSSRSGTASSAAINELKRLLDAQESN